MGFLRKVRGTTDIILLGATAKSAEQHTRAAYDYLALSLANQVLKGSCDPVVAEAALNSHLTTTPEDFVNTAKGERGAKALGRLVLNGALDPLFAEEVLDRSFKMWAVNKALGRINTTN